MFPIEAAVMPLPREEPTPPVTKTYFDMDDLQGGFTNCTGWRRRPPPALLSRFGFRLQYDDLRLPLRGRRRLHRQLRLRRRGCDGHLVEEPFDTVELNLQARHRVMHGHHEARLELAHDLGRFDRVDGGASAYRHQQHVDRRDDLGVRVVERMPEVAEVAHAHVVDLDQVDGVAPSLGALLRV